MNRVEQMQRWFDSDRFKEIQRPYSAFDVVGLQSSLPSVLPASFVSKDLWNLLLKKRRDGEYSHTFGALDPVQVVQMAEELSTVYVSGWQCSSTASTSNEPGPDFADYPMDTVPNKVDQLFRAQALHDRMQNAERSRMDEKDKKVKINYFRPIIADGDTGHGGLTACMKIMKLFIEAGAAGVHLEDQKPGVKKCGHMGGKVLVSVQEHVDRLVAARLQADILNVETVIVARTDADSATLLDNNVDKRDHPYILGVTNVDCTSLNDMVHTLTMQGATEKELNVVKMNWVKNARLMRYPEVVSKAIYGLKHVSKKEQDEMNSFWLSKAYHCSHLDARKLAAELGVGEVYFNWDDCKSREGYFRIKGGLDYSIMRGKAYASYCDLLWMETSRPNLQECTLFAQGIHAQFPRKMLAYNLSPSFNWDAAGMTDKDIAEFQNNIGKLGYVWQFITLAGFHANGLSITNFIREYASKGIISYVTNIQRKERDQNVSTLTHQTWSGAKLADQQIAVVTRGESSTASLGTGSTETQFRSSKL